MTFPLHFHLRPNSRRMVVTKGGGTGPKTPARRTGGAAAASASPARSGGARRGGGTSGKLSRAEFARMVDGSGVNEVFKDILGQILEKKPDDCFAFAAERLEAARAAVLEGKRAAKEAEAGTQLATTPRGSRPPEVPLQPRLGLVIRAPQPGDGQDSDSESSDDEADGKGAVFQGAAVEASLVADVDAGDVVTQINGTTIRSVEDMQVVVGKLAIGGTAEVVLNGGKHKVRIDVLADGYHAKDVAALVRSAEDARKQLGELKPATGIAMEAVPGAKCVRITGVKGKGAGEQAGLKKGMHFSAVADQDVASPADFKVALEKLALHAGDSTTIQLCSADGDELDTVAILVGAAELPFDKVRTLARLRAGDFFGSDVAIPTRPGPPSGKQHIEQASQMRAAAASDALGKLKATIGIAVKTPKKGSGATDSVLVAGVKDDCDAAAQGIGAGTRIASFAGQPTPTKEAFTAAVIAGKLVAGQSVDLGIVDAKGKASTITIVVGAQNATLDEIRKLARTAAGKGTSKGLTAV